MFTTVETETFERLWPHYWTDQAHDEFLTFITENSEAGDVVKGSAACAKCAGIEQVPGNLAVCASFILTAWPMVKSG